MNSKLLHNLRGSLMYATLAALCGARANAQPMIQTPGSAIEVSQCYPHQHAVGTPGHPWVDPYGVYHGPANFPYSEGFLDVTYVNRGRVAANEVDFGLVARQSLIAIVRDVGTFTPGAQIDHEFTVDPQIFPIGTALPYCAVLRVKYSDGTEWRNPSGFQL